jgi:S-adenosyl methyltransferase
MSTSGTDVTKPNVARVYDYLLGGNESYAADREQAAELLRICPSAGMAAFENRYFLARAVTWAAGQGLAQFVDLGAGMPVRKASARVREDIHVTAQAVNPPARVAYVDNDRIVVLHSKVFRAAAAKGVAVADADLTDPATVLARLRVRAVIDPAEPVCLVLGLVLNLMPARQAREVVAGYADLVAARSCVVISCGRCDDEALWKQLSEAYTAAPVYNHTPDEVAGFLAGLELVPPGLAVAQSWRGGWNDVPVLPLGPVYVLAGAAKKL